jgi:phosphoglycerate dehydrogenase-like enzyme
MGHGGGFGGGARGGRSHSLEEHPGSHVRGCGGIVRWRSSGGAGVKIAVTSRSFSRHPLLRAELLERYDRVIFNDDGSLLQGDRLVAFLRGHEAAITALEKLDEPLFAALPQLRVVSKYGVGLDMIDLEAMERHGVLLGWTPGVNRRSVAELVVAAAINLLHGAVTASAAVRAGGWRQIVGRELTGKTVGIIGCGHIGKEVAVLMRGFDCRVLANDIVDYSDFYVKHAIRSVTLDELLRESDVVTIHTPLDATTRNLLCREQLENMNRSAVLINMARGGLIDEGAVKELLIDGRLAAAAFDVFAQEPPLDAELVALPNFIATPHIGGSSEEAILAMGRAAIDGLATARAVGEIFPECFRS